MDIVIDMFTETWFLSVGWLIFVILIPKKCIIKAETKTEALFLGLLTLIAVVIGYVITGGWYFKTIPAVESHAYEIPMLALMSGAWIIPAIATIRVTIVGWRSALEKEEKKKEKIST